MRKMTAASSFHSRAVILGMLLLAVIVSVLAIVYLRGRSRQSMSFWGTTTSELILQAPHVELVHLAPVESTERRDVSQARGLANLRRALMQDASYDWDASLAPPHHWDYALRFRDGDREATMLFTLDPPQAALLDDAERVSTSPIAAGLRAFFEEQFVDHSSSKNR